MDLPAEFGSWKGAYSRLRNWAIDGTWQRVFNIDRSVEFLDLVTACHAVVAAAGRVVPGSRPPLCRAVL
jgi:transposase